jgi:hypothetical protein
LRSQDFELADYLCELFGYRYEGLHDPYAKKQSARTKSVAKPLQVGEFLADKLKT